MKKIFLLLVVCLICLGGCGEKTTTPTEKIDNNKVVAPQIYEATTAKKEYDFTSALAKDYLATATDEEIYILVDKIAKLSRWGNDSFEDTTELTSEQLMSFAEGEIQSSDNAQKYFDEETGRYSYPIADVLPIFQQYIFDYKFNPLDFVDTDFDSETKVISPEQLGSYNSIINFEIIKQTVLQDNIIEFLYYADNEDFPDSEPQCLKIQVQVTANGPKALSCQLADEEIGYILTNLDITKDVIDKETLLETTYFAQVEENSYAEIEFNENNVGNLSANLYFYTTDRVYSNFYTGEVKILDDNTMTMNFEDYNSSWTANLFLFDGKLYFNVLTNDQKCQPIDDESLSLPIILEEKSENQKPRIFFGEDVTLPVPYTTESIDNLIPNMEPKNVIANVDDEFGWYTLEYEDFSLKYVEIIDEQTYYLGNITSSNPDFIPQIYDIKIGDSKESVMKKFYYNDVLKPEYTFENIEDKFTYETINGREHKVYEQEKVYRGEMLYGEWVHAWSYGRATEDNKLFYTSGTYLNFSFDENDKLTTIEHIDSLFW